MSAKPIPIRPSAVTLERTFTGGDQSYRFEVQPIGVVFNLERVSRRSHELWGQLIVHVNGSFPHAKTIEGDVLHDGDINLSSVQARGTRAKILADRSGDKAFDWFGLVEEFAVKTLRSEREGEPSIGLPDIDGGVEADAAIWTMQGLPLLMDLPMVLFGDAAAAKSYLALWLAGTLASRGIPVLYLDWEFSGAAHKRRAQRLFQPLPDSRLFRYRRCDRPLVRIIDGVMGEIRRWHIQYVVCDSIGFAIEGSAFDDEPATKYFTTCRRFNCGSLHLAHIAKHQEEGKDPTIFGSQFFKAGARSAWYIERTKENPQNEIRVGLYHRKYNDGPESRVPLGYKLKFEEKITCIERFDLESDDELRQRLPHLQRLTILIRDLGPQSMKAAADALGTTANTVRVLVARNTNTFMRVGDKINLKGVLYD